MDNLFALLIGFVVIAPSTLFAAEPPVVLQYVERPPYMKTEPNGLVSGISGTIAERAFFQANIAHVWRKVPPERQLATLKQNQERICSVGWYKTTDRELYAKFTKPISHDSPLIGLASANFQVEIGARLDDVLANPDTKVLVKKAVVYGKYLDDKFAHMKAMRINTSDDYELIVRAIRNERAQLTFVPIEEVDYYIEKLGMPRSAFNLIHFAEMPPGEARYIMCSKLVDDSIIQKLNAALK